MARLLLLLACVSLVACGSDDRRRRTDGAVPFDANLDIGLSDVPLADVPGADVPASNCGNNMIDFGEDCDGFNLNGESCITLGGEGTLQCDEICNFDESLCTFIGDAELVLEGGLLGVRTGGMLLGVCDDSFEANDGIVACRTLGLAYVSHEQSADGPSSEFFMDDVGCNGSEASIFDCPYSDMSRENCGSGEWVMLICE